MSPEIQIHPGKTSDICIKIQEQLVYLAFLTSLILAGVKIIIS